MEKLFLAASAIERKKRQRKTCGRSSSSNKALATCHLQLATCPLASNEREREQLQAELESDDEAKQAKGEAGSEVEDGTWLGLHVL